MIFYLRLKRGESITAIYINLSNGSWRFLFYNKCYRLRHSFRFKDLTFPVPFLHLFALLFPSLSTHFRRVYKTNSNSILSNRPS